MRRIASAAGAATGEVTSSPARVKRRGQAEPPVHLHIENMSWTDEVFHITHERFEAGARRHPDVAQRVRATIGYDLERFEHDIATAEVLVCWDFRRQELARRAPHLSWIHVTGAGLEHLMPLDWLPKGVTLTNNRGVHAEKAGEFGIAAILMSNNGVPEMMTSQRQAVWKQEFRTPIKGKTLVVVGVGNMGAAIARQAKRFGLRVLGVRRSGRPRRYVDEMYKTDDLARVLPQADFVVVTLPLTPATRGLIGRRLLDLVKPSAGIINMGRAGVIDYEVLADKLSAGELANAILDVFDPEPLPSSSRLWRTPNLFITPHCSSDDLESYSPLTIDLVFENLRRFIDRKPLLNIVSRKHQY